MSIPGYDDCARLDIFTGWNPLPNTLELTNIT
jgi:hypothetical protein